MSNAPSTRCPQPFVAKPPSFVPPKGAIDAHCHIYGKVADYPYDPNTWYLPPLVDVPDYLRLLDTLGIERAVFVHAAVYADHAVILDTMAAHPGRFRGVAQLRESVSDAELAKLNAGGVRGFRANLVSGNGMKLDGAKRLADRVAKFNWHAQFLLDAEAMPEMDKTLADFPIQVVVDHMGRPNIDAGTDAPGFQALIRLLKSGRAWCKLSAPYRTSKTQPGFTDIDRYAQALVAAVPDRLVWGSDWPHVNMEAGKPMPNDGDLLDKLAVWAPTEELRRRILVANPEKLYGFDPV
ncbi:MAG: transcriptional regulator, GntR family/amidohydrolase family protein [Betaproteobacteria bacterium]|nr:transcriptional regulator, GntR family/amidohydrolase family protein [Betaproteobacteria bacterium]